MWPIGPRFRPDVFGPNLMWFVVLMWPNCYKKSKRFKKASKFKDEFNNSRERLALKKKIKDFTSLKENFKRKISSFKNPREISKM